MSFSSKQIHLRDQRSCLLRPLQGADGPAMFALERALLRAAEGTVRAEDEMPNEQTHHEQLKTSLSTNLHLVAQSPEGILIGEVSLRRFPLRMLRHSGILGIGVHPSAQGVGLGRALMENMILWARAEGLLRIELYTRADNTRAIQLYHSLGFLLEGTRRNFLRRDDGSFLDDYVMGLWLEANNR